MSDWQAKKVAVIGLGVSNIPLIRFLKKEGAQISGRDKKDRDALKERYQELVALGVDLKLGYDYLLDLEDFDYVFLTPGIPKHLPEIRRLRGKVPILSEIALVLQLARAPVFGITGSSGKTTTTSLVGEMLKSSGIGVYVGGNIGVPLIEKVREIPKDARIVLELSSFQLELLDVSPNGALVTNLTENHLDIHLTMENYINAKKQIYKHQKPDDVAVFNLDDPITAKMGQECPSQTFFFSMVKNVPRGAYLDGEHLFFTDGQETIEIVNRSEIALRGDHNVQNVLGAIVLARLAGASFEGIRHVIQNFSGVPHRLEEVLTVNGVKYFNDSIATSPSRAIAGLKAFDQPIVLIAGGYDKKLPFAAFAKEVVKRVKHLVVLGETKEKIISEVEREKEEQGYSKFPTIHQVDHMEEAVSVANKVATKGDIVLLSPACASFDMYPNFEVRGAHFRELVDRMGRKGF